jgi:hypothetical protein
MTVLLMDGFDSYNGTGTSVGTRSGWTPSSAVNLGGTATGRFGGLSFAPHASNGWQKLLAAAAGSICFGASFQYSSGSASANLWFANGAAGHASVVFDSTGAIRLRGPGGELAASAANAVKDGVWHTVEIELIVHDTTGRISAYVDGLKVAEATNVDTRNGATTTVDRVQIGGTSVGGSSSSGSHFWDDVWVIDSAARPANTPRVVTHVPTSDGATLNLTPSTGATHFGVVDELPASTSDYLQGTTVGHVDELGISAFTTSPVDIQGVQAVMYAGKTDVTARQAVVGIKSGATTAESAALTLATTGGRVAVIATNDPNTAAAWTEAGVEAAQLRPRIAA